MLQWRRPALAGLVTSLFPLAFFVLWNLSIRALYQRMFDDFGSKVPRLTTLVMHPAYGIFALAVLVAGLALGLARPNERFLIFPLTAGGGFALFGLTMMATYLPVFSLADAIK